MANKKQSKPTNNNADFSKLTNTNLEHLTDEFPDQPTNPPSQSPKTANFYSTQSSLQIAEIRDSIVVLKDGSFRAVIQAEAINFDLMNPQEQESVEYTYQAFINSLYFPIQINIQSRRIDAQGYLKKIEASLKQQNNMLLSVLIIDYLDFIANLIDSTDVMSKNFYIIVPFYNTDFSKENISNASKTFFRKLWGFKQKPSPLIINEQTLQKAKRELRYRIQTVVDGLVACGVNSKQLNTQELITMYYNYYNPDTFLSQSLVNFSDISTSFVSKKGDYQQQESVQKDYEKQQDETSVIDAPSPETIIPPQAETKPKSELEIKVESAPQPPAEAKPQTKGSTQESVLEATTQTPTYNEAEVQAKPPQGDEHESKT